MPRTWPLWGHDKYPHHTLKVSAWVTENHMPFETLVYFNRTHLQCWAMCTFSNFSLKKINFLAAPLNTTSLQKFGKLGTRCVRRDFSRILSNTPSFTRDSRYDGLALCQLATLSTLSLLPFHKRRRMIFLFNLLEKYASQHASVPSLPNCHKNAIFSVEIHFMQISGIFALKVSVNFWKVWPLWEHCELWMIEM